MASDLGELLLQDNSSSSDDDGANTAKMQGVDSQWLVTVVAAACGGTGAGAARSVHTRLEVEQIKMQ